MGHGCTQPAETGNSPTGALQASPISSGALQWGACAQSRPGRCHYVHVWITSPPCHHSGHTKHTQAARKQLKQIAATRQHHSAHCGRLDQSMHGTGVTLLHMQEIPLLTGDLSDRQSLKAIAAQTRVVLNTAGPYTKLGTPVVEACISEKTHHCDLTGACPGLSCSFSSISAHAYSKHLRILWGGATLQMADPPTVLLAQASTHAGEYTWVKQIQRQYQDEAANNGVKIVNCCGFDSIPSDLGAQMLVNHIKEKFGRCMQPPHCPPHANDQPPANSFAFVMLCTCHTLTSCSTKLILDLHAVH